nr:PREDICTED: transcription elongation factor 1 homolog [Anolis carolinensis]|eukprot:XP_003216865.3 PREDICTED: transcription elongation factor 1 homolog [Anolis carolinensis]
MGRRKSKRKPPPKKKMTGTLETQFTCPFCNHEKSCDVKMDRARNTGVISCTVCLEEFQTPITYLSEPVDVYSDWIDAWGGSQSVVTNGRRICPALTNLLNLEVLAKYPRHLVTNDYLLICTELYSSTSITAVISEAAKN